MKNKICELCFSFLTLLLFACGFAAAIFIGIMLMPFVFIGVIVLAIREIIAWKRKVKSVKPSYKAQKSASIVKELSSLTIEQKNAA